MNDEDYFKEAAKEAKKSPCLRAKCGSIVLLKNIIVGRGFNSPPNNDITKRKCEISLIKSLKPRSDRTCCVHAEWRAIIDAIKNNKNIKGSILYFTRVDNEGNILKSGQPYCTVCSRLALDNGIEYFALWHDSGVKIYDTDKYNELSYQFHNQ
jgi:deoxycytidylate deaminase